MTPVELIEQLSLLIRDSVKNYRLLSELETDLATQQLKKVYKLKKVSVYEQEIPEEDFNDDSYYPLVIVSLQKIQDQIEESEVKPTLMIVGLTIGVYGEDKNSWKDLLNLTETIRSCALLNKMVAKKFRLVEVVDSDFIEKQPYPFHFSYITLIYSTFQPRSTKTIEWS